MRVEDIAALVAIRMDEWADRKAAVSDGRRYHLDSIVEELLPLAAAEILMEGDPERMDCVRDCSEQLIKTTDFGEGEEAVGELPADFLRPVRFRLSGWCRYEILPPAGDMQPRRIAFFPAAGKRIIEATYIPRPYLETGRLRDFPERMLPPLIEKLVSLINSGQGPA